ncbi:hypothetical protein GpartN1_g5254.t1 [Galdieria partita]|uniref:Amino acid transporter transmembrane domain-containing protein n=1 Tax=Galdieria partita TaxID=83374 RepID=A0A9C7US65_9RHOD|nr:hypothetical protein GpartN1_g947.t1 [Galdieria partita]GJQ13463.1 hypothetical protein GpartN1_g5254.t1 [Galdieria partita]
MEKSQLDDNVIEAAHEHPEFHHENYDPDHLPKDLKANWIMVVILIVAETESSGPLSLATAVQSLGYVPGAIVLVLLGIIAGYTGVLIAEIWEKHPHVRNYDEVIEIFFGRFGKEIALWSQIMLLWFFIASCIMPAAQAFYVTANESVCYVIWMIIVTIVGILISLPRTLKGVAYISIFAVIFFLVPAVMTITGVASQNMPLPGLPLNTSPNATITFPNSIYNIFVSINDIIFAYAGHLLFFNLILEMGNPKEFKKAVIWGFIINTIDYTLIGICIYAYTGIYSQSPYFLNLSRISVQKAAFLLSVVNLLIASMNYAHLASKNVLRRFPSLKGIAYKTGWKHWIGWILIVSVMWIVPWIGAELIPVFNDLIGIGGALFASQFTYGLPCLLWILDHRMEIRRGKHLWKFFLLIAIYLLSLLSLGVGVYSSIDNIVQLRNANQIPAPFSCSTVP